MITELEQQQLLTTFKKHIVADPRIEIGPVAENPTPVKPGVWMPVAGELAYLGASYEASLLTARLCDWWIPERDGEMLSDDVEWFEQRAKLGENWEEKELRMFRQERRTRLALNIGLATSGELDNDQEK